MGTREFSSCGRHKWCFFFLHQNIREHVITVIRKGITDRVFASSFRVNIQNNFFLAIRIIG